MPDTNSVPIAEVTKTAPFDEDGVEIAKSVLQVNTPAEHRAAEVTVVVSEMTPNRDDISVGYMVHLRLEERVSAEPEAWVLRARSDEWNFGFQKVHVISLRPGAVTNPGTEENVGTSAEPVLVMYVGGVLPKEYRIRLMKTITNSERADLQSITFAAYLRTYNLIPS